MLITRYRNCLFPNIYRKEGKSNVVIFWAVSPVVKDYPVYLLFPGRSMTFTDKDYSEVIFNSKFFTGRVIMNDDGEEVLSKVMLHYEDNKIGTQKITCA